jgi:hypothetical protein
MFALKICLNQQEAIVAGAEDLGVLTAYVSIAGALGPRSLHPRPSEPPDMWCSLKGLTSRDAASSDEHLHWLSQHELKVGDRITIEVVETEAPHQPVARCLAQRKV